MTRKSRSPIDDRLRHLEKEVQRVQGGIKVLAKAVHNPDLGELLRVSDKVRTTMEARVQAAPAENAPGKQPAEAPPEAAAKPPEDGPRKKASRAKPAPAPEAAEAAPDTLRTPQPPPGASGRNLRAPYRAGTHISPFRDAKDHSPLSDDYRFANYLNTVGINAPKPTRRERSIQRNRALLMLALVAISLYVVIKLLTR